MNRRRFGGAARLLMMAAMMSLPVYAASAAMVSFLVVETGLHDEVSSSQYSSVWEGGMMDAFFNAGHIVTNNPVARLDKMPAVDLTGSVKYDFDEAVEGGAEYFVLAYLEYQEQRRVPTGITVKIFRTDTAALVYEGSFPAGTARTLNEEYQVAQNAGRLIISNIRDR